MKERRREEEEKTKPNYLFKDEMSRRENLHLKSLNLYIIFYYIFPIVVETFPCQKKLIHRFCCVLFRFFFLLLLLLIDKN